MNNYNILQNITNEVETIRDTQVYGIVCAINGALIKATGVEKLASIGSKCHIITPNNRKILAEVIAIEEKTTLLMPFEPVTGVNYGCVVSLLHSEQFIYPNQLWLGRVIDFRGNPIDGKGHLPKGQLAYNLYSSPPPPHSRRKVREKLDMGVRSINTFLSCCKGQRMGIFAGSGVGKSMLMAMLTKFANTDIKIIGLIGERGREVKEFIEDYLGEEGLAKSIIVVATSDESALSKKQAAHLTLALCEYYRDMGKEVLCLMDNLTRIAMAQREIGLAAGEPPTTKGYPPSIFNLLPALLERAGPGTDDQGNITAFFNVLIEGDDVNEPIADAARGFLDGHIVLDRSIAAKGIYPAINVINSVSRTMPNCNNEYQNKLIQKAQNLVSIYNDMADMIRIGAYKKGSDPLVDEAIKYNEAINNFISQRHNEYDTLDESYKKLAKAINFGN